VTDPAAGPGAAADEGAAAPASTRFPEPGAAPPRPVPVPGIVRRRLASPRTPTGPYLLSWLATGAVALVAAVLRLVGLRHPPGKIFDETYYATEAWGLLHHGVEWNTKDDSAAYVVHPPLGKWAIALGELAYGHNEFGWRISAVVAGVLSVVLLTRVVRLLFGSTVLGCAAGLLMALDGMHFVLSRSALLDIFLMLFVFAAFGALVLDRNARRRRWLRALERGVDPAQPGRAGRPGWSWAAVPWWRLLAAVLLGCALGVKWSAAFFVPAFALLVVWWEVGARRSAGVRHPWRDTLLDEGGWLLLCGLLIVATYLATWTGWFVSDDGYFRHYRADRFGTPETPVVDALFNLWHYHGEAFRFHSTLTSHHTYQSWPWEWLLLSRPVAFYWSSDGPCGATNCASEVLLLGTPVLWWSFLPALAALAWLGIARRDWRAGAIWIGVAAGLLPWFYYAAQGRTMFYFYALPAEPFLIMALVYVLGAIGAPGRRGLSDDARRLVGGVTLGAFVLLVAVCFAYFYPLYIGEVLPYADWSKRIFLGARWI
jgi:dolichyl-phosphate-mannose-protein mannosyltransferase